MTNETLRLFVAIELPEAWGRALSLYQDALKRKTGTVRGISWSRPEGFHMTLKFIGPFKRLELPQLTDALSSAVAQPLDLRMILGQAYVFGGRPIPRVLAVGYHAPGHKESLEALVRRLDSSLVPLGVGKESRRFLPHITLARIRPEIDRGSLDDLYSAMRSSELQETDPFDAKQLSLMRSHLGPGGARYERIAAFPPKA